MEIAFKRLPEIDPQDVIVLMNDPRVRRHLPLASGVFDAAACAAFVADKERLWAEHGYGPWAFVIDGAFAGWGGLQPEDGDADLGLVLHPRFWGAGPVIFREILRRGFDEMGFASVTILLPLSRSRPRAMSRLGFSPDGVLEIAGVQFFRYRCKAHGVAPIP